MIIREYRQSDINDILNLFYDTVHTINKKDYEKEQLEVWAPVVPEKDKWERFFTNNFTYVAIVDSKLVGFTDLTKEGYINTLYVHRDYQNKGIATTLLCKLQKEANRLGISKLTTEASITAKVFFKNKGFSIVKEQKKQHNNMIFINYIMEKFLV